MNESQIKVVLVDISTYDGGLAARLFFFLPALAEFIRYSGQEARQLEREEIREDM